MQRNLYKLMMTLKKPFDKILAERPIPILHIGAGKLRSFDSMLSSMGVSNLYIVTDKAIRSLGLLDPLLELLQKNDIGYTIFDDVIPDPTYEIVERGLQLLQQTASEKSGNGVLAFGGGSVIDATKGIVAAYDSCKNPSKLKGLLKVRRRVTPFFVVPTTAGTGSEATIVAVISDTKTHKKGLIISPKLIPDAVVLDPEVTVGLPPLLTAATGADALTHALEAYVSRYANEKSSVYGEIAVRLIFKHLEEAVLHPKNLESREALLLASTYGGMAFTRAYVGYVHAFSHNIGGKFGVAHGLANGVILPHVMRFYQTECTAKFAQLAEIIGLPGDGLSEQERAEAFIHALQTLLDRVGIPKKLDGFPRSAVPMITKMAFKECHTTYPVPKYMSTLEARALLEECAGGQ